MTASPQHQEQVEDAYAAREAELEDGRMPFMEHLRELRKRLTVSVIAVFVGFLITYNFSSQLFAIIVKPLNNVMVELAAQNSGLSPESLYFTKLHEPFWVFVSVGFWASLFLASPVVFYQLWKFVAPGLYKTERRFGVIFALASGILFTSGAVFCYTQVLEPVFRFLLGYSTENIGEISSMLGGDYQVGKQVGLQPMLTIGEYLAFAKRLLLGFGLIFELPLAILFLTFAGLVTHRSLWRFNRWFIVIAFVVGAMLTPPDIYSQALMAGPLIILYQISIGISWLVTVSKERKQAKL